MGIRDDLKQAIYGQESSYGKADTSQENYAGARGPMQVTKSTFESMKAQGLIPAEYSHANPEHTKAAGFKLIDQLADKYQDDPAKVAAAYYGGEKAVLPDGSIANFGDLKNPKAPKVHDYVNQVLGRMGITTDAEFRDSENPAPRTSVLDSWDTPMPGRQVLPQGLSATTRKEVSVSTGLELSRGAIPEDVRIKAKELQDQATQKEIDESSFYSKSKDAFIQNTFAGSAIRAALRPQYEVDPSFQVKPEDLSGLTEDEQNFVKQAVSQENLERIKWEIEDNRASQKNINLSGSGVGIAASLFAGLPEGYLTGMGAMRAFQLGRVGSLQLAAQGLRGQAIGSAILENVGTNLAMTAVQQTFDPYVSGHDYAMAVGMGFLGAGLNLPSIFSVEKAAIKATADRLMLESAKKQAAVREQAVKNLGPEATPEALRAEVERLEANKVRETLSVGEVPESRKLTADPIEGEKKMEELAKEAAASAEAPIATGRPGVEQMGFNARKLPEFSEIGVPHTEHNVADVLTNIVDTHYDSVTKAVANRLLNAENSGLRIIETKDVGAMFPGTAEPKGGWRAVYDNSRHAVILPEGYLSNPRRADVVNHEVAHAVTVHKLYATKYAPDSVAAGISKELDDLRSTVQAAYDLVGGHANPELDRQIKYYLSNPREFVAGLYSGRSAFTDFLKTVQVDGSTVWNKFVDSMRRLFGLEGKELDAFTRGLSLSEDLISTPMDVRLSTGTDLNFANPNQKAAAQAKHVSDLLADPVAQKNGLGLLPVDTPQQQAELAALTDLFRKAEAMNLKVDEKRLSKLLDTAIFQGGQSIANVLARSKNPVARMISAELLENPSGSLGRRSTAALAKHLNERQYLGNTLNEVQDLYTVFRNQQGQSAIGDFFGGKTWEQFNRLVAEEIEGRRAGHIRAQSPEAVVKAADSLEKAYERMRVAQQDAKTIGWGALPETSVGYMPHRMDPAKLTAMTQEQRAVLHDALVDQFINISGFDISFADNLASKYIQKVHDRAMGGFSAPIGAHQVGAADVVEDALEAMGMSRPQVLAAMKKYQRGAASHTKKRLNLDLTATHTLKDGSEFRLMDVMDTDHFNLLRNQARRVSGEVALAQHGVMGKPGLNVLRTAMTYGADGARATPDELHAFDQLAAEFLGDSFGTHNRNLDRLMQVNTLARLGGMGFTQLAESINGMFHVGVAKSFSAVADLPRLRSEILALSRGEKVNNPIIGSLEQYRGVEFGTDAYKIVFPYDSTSATPTYGRDTLNMADRLLRGGGYVQGKLSMWRAIHSTQQRGFAEQIVRKAAEYIHGGLEDVALKDMGISAELSKKIRDSGAIVMEGNRLKEFDITKVADKAAAEEFVQAIHRGVGQIIQDSFIGEKGKWAHDGLMRLMTQFRTFSITSVEKQWGRQVGNVGTYKALGMMMGAMSLAAPIYMARTYLQSIGREDREAYLEKQLTFDKIARATLNYIAMSGLAGDFLDVTSSVTGVGESTGGRAGQGQSFLGNVVAPAAGLLEDTYKGIQNTKDGTDPKQLLRSMPFSRVPYLIPAIQALGG